MRILDNSCIIKTDRMVRKRRKYCAVSPREEVRQAASKTRRDVSIKTAVEDRKRCNNAVMGKRLNTVSQRRVDKAKNLVPPLLIELHVWNTHHTCETCSICHFFSVRLT